MAANDAVRRQVVEVRGRLLQEGPGSAQAVLRQSIRWLSLMVEAGYNPDYQLDAIFMCFEASKVKIATKKAPFRLRDDYFCVNFCVEAMNNTRAMKHWAQLGARISTLTRGPGSRNTLYFQTHNESIG